jgi:hypothetical protein
VGGTVLADELLPFCVSPSLATYTKSPSMHCACSNLLAWHFIDGSQSLGRTTLLW